MQIAFIGLGNMGLPMALNLVKAGFCVRGFDLAESAMQSFAAAGGITAACAGSAVMDADVVVTMLPTSKHVRTLYLGGQGLLSQVKDGALLMDSSSIAAAVSRELAAAAASRGLDMIDAPASGGTLLAQTGGLTFMVGGSPQQLERARPVLERMGKKILHAGGSGAGQVAKACNNMLLGIIMIGNSEALQLGIAHGLDPKELSEIIGSSSGANWCLATNNPCPGVVDVAPSSRGYSGGFAGDLMLKDLGLAIAAALESGSTTPLGALTHNLFRLHSAQGHGKKDLASIFQLLTPRSA